MKCMANQDESVVLRVSNEKAEIMQHEGFHFVSKELWKTKTRDVNKKETITKKKKGKKNKK
jgi:hypothetical protein